MIGLALGEQHGSNAPDGARVAELVRCFERIAQTRIAGLPMINPRLSVEAVGFERVPGSMPDALAGILLTPWFMSLVWLPVERDAVERSAGEPIERAVAGDHVFEFVPNVLDGIGRIESCSLFSPMNEFATQIDARNTAQEILRMLRVRSVDAADAADAAGSVDVARGASRSGHARSRREFLFGRSRAGA